MATVLSTVLTCMCLPVLIPLILGSINTLIRGEITLTRLSFLGMRVTRFTGLAAYIFAGSQLFGGMFALNGLFAGITENSLVPLINNVTVGLIVGLLGTLFARNMGFGVEISEQAPPNVSFQSMFRQVQQNEDGTFTVQTEQYDTETDQTTPENYLEPGEDWSDDDNIEDADFRDVD